MVSAVTFPRGRQFAVTWSIPDDFGGMTSALLHRSRAFVRLAGAPVDVLTFDTRPDYPDLERRLREQGELIDGLGIINLWDWLRANPVAADAAGSLDLEKHAFTPLAADRAYVATKRGDTELSRTRLAADGTTALQVDHYREDGTLLASDRRDARTPGTLDGRSVVLCDVAGQPLRSFGGIWALYRFWLDLVRDREPSFMIVDSKTIATFMMTYVRKRAVIIHLVHSSHLSGTQRPIGELRESRREVFENLGKWDSVVVLTDRQRTDVVALLGPQPNLAVVPNGRDLDTPALADRPVGAGIVLAALTSRKRVAHAIRAIASAPGATLDIYGDGEERAALEALAGDTVKFHGHDRGARAKLAEASFLLLTSSSEGFPLVLVEAMAAGCLPIAYDVPYGPADIIRDGRNGFLVAPGDEAGLSAAIRRLQSMSPRAVAKMRRDAQRTASDYSDLAVTKLWATAMRDADKRKAAEWARSHAVG